MTKNAKRGKTTAETLGAVVGRQLAQMRQQTGLTQEVVARSARQMGLRWTRSVVATVEAGGRDLTVDELVGLTRMFDTEPMRELIDQPVTLATLVPDKARIHTNAGAYVFTGKQLLRLLGGDHVPTKDLDVDVFRDTDVEVNPRYLGEAEYKAARQLGMDVDDLGYLSRRMWGRSLTDERDARLGERADLTTTNARRVALGNITRQLLNEISEQIEGE